MMLALSIALNALVALAAATSSASNDVHSMDQKCSEGFFPGYYGPTVQFGVEPARFLSVTGSFFRSQWTVRHSFGSSMLFAY